MNQTSYIHNLELQQSRSNVTTTLGVHKRCVPWVSTKRLKTYRKLEAWNASRITPLYGKSKAMQGHAWGLSRDFRKCHITFQENSTACNICCYISVLLGKKRRSFSAAKKFLLCTGSLGLEGHKASISINEHLTNNRNTFSKMPFHETFKNELCFL